VFDSKPNGGSLEVVGTSRVSALGHQKGAQIVFGVVKNMNPALFTSLVNNKVTLGIFAYSDPGWATTFPAFKHLADKPGCQNNCGGACSGTCSGDGRKYGTITGIATTFAAILESNILCDNQDPFRGSESIAIHEFGHAVHFGVQNAHASAANQNYGNWIQSVYNNARSRNIWASNSYAMSNAFEFFGEAATTYFNCILTSNAGGMNHCNGVSIGCADELAARAYIQRKDNLLYTVLNNVLTNGNDKLRSGLKICI